MIHAALFVESDHYRSLNFSTHAADRPLVVQFCANDPDTFVRAAQLVQGACDAVSAAHAAASLRCFDPVRPHRVVCDRVVCG
jgi:hypothetical protein